MTQFFGPTTLLLLGSNYISVTSVCQYDQCSSYIATFFSFRNISLIATLNDSLYDIEKKINHKIKEIKDKKKKTNQRTKTDRLWVRIEALQLALAQILA
ncbi:MAG TPA: hypothetical protein VFJ51_13590 [Nitrososphaeraceae archaeon]|nr:hypothetical protein [Nitrososphaeraceae archaeon]